MNKEKEALTIIFPKDIFEWFDIRDTKTDTDNVYVTFEEKDIPPLSEENKHKKILKKKFHNITITDFPIRGKRTLLTFRRRYWKLEGEEKLLKRDIKTTFPGTQLEKEFADFLKEKSRNIPGFSQLYSRFVQPPNKRI
jgi:hypothetical protein